MEEWAMVGTATAMIAAACACTKLSEGSLLSALRWYHHFVEIMAMIRFKR